MTVLKWAVRVHKWVALVVGLQIMLWIAGGVVMSVIPIEIVRGEHKIAAQDAAPISVEGLLPLSSAASALGEAGLKSASLGHFAGRVVWRVETAGGTVRVVDARSGEIVGPMTAAVAREIAIRDYSGSGEIVAIELLETPPSEYARPGPVWRAQFDDPDKTTLYIDPARGEVAARRSQTWRFYDFFWKLHIMDYDDGADFNHPLLITAAGAAAFLALSGLCLLTIKMRRSLIVWRRAQINASARRRAQGQTS